MNYIKYIFRGLAYYKKKHLAVLLAVALSTMVLTGALMVGESVKFSLQHIVKQRLGETGFALSTGDRKVSNELVLKVGNEMNLTVAGLIELNGLAVNPGKDLRLPNTQVYGVDSSFWKLSNKSMKELERNQAYLSQNLVNRINADSGDFVLLRLKAPQTIAINSPFSQEEELTVSVRVQIVGVVDDESFGRFSLKSDQKSPYNVFVNKSYLAQKLEFQGFNNQLLVQGSRGIKTTDLDLCLQKNWSLTDLGIQVKELGDGKLLVSSNQIFIPEALSQSVRSFADASASLTYLVNELSFQNQATPYSFVSGIESELTSSLSSNDIIINEWLAEDLHINIGDSIAMKYFSFGTFRNLEERTMLFCVKSIEPNAGAAFSNDLMPDFPGLSDAGSCSEWDTGVPIDLDKIRKKDEVYWDEYKGTPKAIIPLKTAQRLWENDYGVETGLIISQAKPDKNGLEQHLLHSISPQKVGLNFQSVKRGGLFSASNGVDFGELFLSLSFFVIVAAILLLVVILVLNFMARKNEWLTLQALGISNSWIKKMAIAESLLPLLLGVLLGGLLGALYNNWLIIALNSIWHDAVYTEHLMAHFSLVILIYGAVGGLIIGLVCVYLVVNKQLVKQNSPVKSKKRMGNIVIKLWASFLLLIVLIVLLIAFADNPSISLISGFGLLMLGLWWLNVWILRIGKQSGTRFTFVTMILKNLSQNRTRSLLTVSLLSIGVFTVIVTGANRKTFTGAEHMASSGTGAYTFWAESTLPILYDLNTTTGKEKLGIADEAVFDSVKWLQMNLLAGDDASCLNLNLVQQPAILGVNVETLHQKKAFSFSKLHAQVNKENPWLYLTEELSLGVIPVYLDQTVIQWGLMKKVGDTLSVLNERGDPLKLLIAGGLQASIFQGHILMAQNHFLKHFPSKAGASVFLIENPKLIENELLKELQFYFKDFGFEVQHTTQRLSAFNAVTNTYLNIFMLLGGLAVMIGTLGFSVVIYRSLLERKKELAILLSIGYRRNKILKMLLLEYGLLLFVAIFIGLLSASLGILPSMVSSTFQVSVSFLSTILFVIIINGAVWIFISVRLALKNELISTLKSE